MKVFDAATMKEMDEITESEYGIPIMLTMSKAAEALMDVIVEGQYQHVLVVCGNGNNGGDGFALATLLQRFTRVNVRILVVSDTSTLSAAARLYYTLAQRLHIPLFVQPDEEQMCVELETCDIVVDCIFGCGLNRKIEGYLEHCIQLINQCAGFKLSCDIPSGIGADDGNVYGIAVHADRTITFQNPKLGLYVKEGPHYCGNISIVNIGIPATVISSLSEVAQILNKQELAEFLPKRMLHSHKGDYGKVLLIGGSEGMPGALKLAVKATLKTGCGLTYMAFPKSLMQTMTSDIDEALSLACDEQEGHMISCKRLIDLAKHCDVLAFGNGIGRSKEISELLKDLLELNKAMVIDADGLWALREHLPLLKKRTAETILTPHDMELARLISCDYETLVKNRFALAKAFVNEYPITLVVKGMNSWILHGDKVYINTTGNNSLSKGGSGDVLCGIISGLLAQNKHGVEATTLAVYLHGLSADLNVKSSSVYTSTPSDLIQTLPEAFHQIIK